MLILAFDTAVAACSVAVWRDGATLACVRRRMDRGQAEHLVPMIADAVAEAGVGYDAIERIAVTVGPGSFTGVRVGLAAARGLALAHKVPVIGATTGEVLAGEAATRTIDSSAIVSLIDSKRGDLYVESFTRSGTPLAQVAAIARTDVVEWMERQFPSGNVAFVGDGTDSVRAHARFRVFTEIVTPDPAILADLAAARVPGASPVPLYVRPPDVTMPGTQ